jgi:type II restriction/modification system DNA methylase subunit YeeA
MGAMTPLDFVNKWRESELRERQGSQMHFLELCDLLGEPRPSDPENYCFERGAEKVGGGDGWADVWRKGCFAWEYKGKHANLAAALRQLQTYTLDLQMPPYLVVSDMERIVVHTNWNNTVSEKHEWVLDDLLDTQKLDLLKQVFNGSEKLKPKISPQELTAKAAQRFGDIGRRLQERNRDDPEKRHDPRTVAHFLNRIIFCMFAEDAGLLPKDLFTRTIKAVQKNPDNAFDQLRDLFRKMHQKDGGFFGEHRIDWFNGGLFDGDDVLRLETLDLKEIADLAGEHDWSEIDPAIFGTLFEQALKATRERPALGAHYTDREKILKIVEPVITRPLMAEWEEAHAEIAALMTEVHAAEVEERAIRDEGGAQMKQRLESLPKDLKDEEKSRQRYDIARQLADDREAQRNRLARLRTKRNRAYTAAKERLDLFLNKLAAFRVLDPACGSGNFLYVALHALHDLERRAHGDVLRLGLEHPAPRVSVRQLRGIEIERYAAELARVTLWIGDLQWLKKNGYLPDRRPILDTLDQIEERDALLDRSKGSEPKDWPEAEWPETDVIIGNPPFVGGKKMRENFRNDALVNRLFEVYDGRVPGEADLVCYWLEKAWREIGAGRAARAGFVTTNSIRGGANRRVLEPIVSSDALFEAWSDEPWVVQGAAVRVSQVGFGNGFVARRLNAQTAIHINADLTAADTDLTKSTRLIENSRCAFQGPVKVGAFDIDGSTAREWITAPANPNGQGNITVLRPWANGLDIARRPLDKWIIDFDGLSEKEAALFELPFRH